MTPKAGPALGGLFAEIAALEAQVAAGVPTEHRDALKRRIAAAFRQTEAALTELGLARERIKSVVDRYKEAVSAPDDEGGLRLEATRPRIQADHLGASTFIEKGWSLIALGDHPAATQALTKALELAPGDLQAQSLLGWALMLDHRLDDALMTFSKVLAVEPTNALARVNVGYICLKKRIFGEAIEHLSRAIRLDNDRKGTLYAHYYLGLVYLEREMYLDAQAFLTKAIGLGPNLIEAYYELGRAQWFSGEEAAAKATWKRGADANRFAPWAKRCRELLASVELGGVVPRSSPSA